MSGVSPAAWDQLFGGGFRPFSAFGASVQIKRVSSGQTCGNAANTQSSEQLARGGHGAIDVDAAAGILDHDRLEAFAARVFRRIAYTEIEGEAGEKHAPEAALAQVSGKSRPRLAIVFGERRIGIDLAVIALAQHQLGVGNLQVLTQRSALCALHAM